MSPFDRHLQILGPVALNDARAQARKAIAEVGVPTDLIETLRPVLAPMAEQLARLHQDNNPSAAA
ncbi:hypothetical protein [Streptomyces sp. C10-9-1]|uniref:hypothetical protein n=1 Tax=Streptomyces sp. C10-9-1 TaxID=1859285 RepID=UPI003F4A4305